MHSQANKSNKFFYKELKIWLVIINHHHLLPLLLPLLPGTLLNENIKDEVNEAEKWNKCIIPCKQDDVL